MPPMSASGLKEELPTPSSYMATWREFVRSRDWNTRQTLVRHTREAAFPVPSDSRTMFFRSVTRETPTPVVRRRSGGVPRARGWMSLHDLALAQSSHLRRGHPEVLEDGVGVLAAERRGAANGAGRVGQLDRDAELLDAPLRGMLDVHDHLSVVDLRILHHFVHVVHLAHAHVRLHEQLVPLITILRPDDAFDLSARGLFAVFCRA